MVSQDLARPAARDVPESLQVVGIAVGFAAIGLILRYLAYVSVVPGASLADFPDALCRFDCTWYVRLAEEGYDPFPVPSMINAGNWAFFPLYPMLIGLVRGFVAAPTMTIATAMSVALSVVAVVMSWPLFERNRRAYALFGAFVLSGPFSIYFTTFYTETAFLLLTIGVFVMLRRSNYLGAGIYAALLSATRIVGVFAVLSIVVQAFVDHRRAGGSTLSFPRAALGRADLVLAVFLAPIGLFLYMAFLYRLVGDALAFQHVQRAWARIFGDPLFFLWTGLAHVPDSGFIPTPSQQLAAASIAGLMLAGYVLWKRRYAEALFSFVTLIVPLFAGLASMIRFNAAQAPIMIALMELLSLRRPVYLAALLAILAGGYFVTMGWLDGYISLI